MSASTDKTGAKTATGGHFVRAGSNTMVSVIAAAAVLVMVNYLSMRHYVRADWTGSGLYTLSDKTAQVLAGLDKDVQLHVLWSKGASGGQFAAVKELLDRYAAMSNRLRLEYIDPDINPDRAQILINQYGARVHQDMLGQQLVEAGVFVVCEDKVKLISAEDFEDFSGDLFGGAAEPDQGVSRFKGEQEITAAIMRVTSAQQTKICFVQGHGEWSLEADQERSLSHIKQSLKRDSFEVDALATTGASRVPKSCDLVVVAGPTKALLEAEVALLKHYLKRGGRLMLLLDPLVEGTRFVPTGLESLTAEFGVKLTNDMIFETDPRRLVSQSPFTLLASEFTPHQAVKRLAVSDRVGADVKAEIGAAPVVFATARSLGQIDAVRSTAEILAKSSAESWGEVDLNWIESAEQTPEKDQYDTQGPVVFAMAATLGVEDGGHDRAGRLVVVGDSDFLAEELMINAGLYNRDFWSGLTGWLTERRALISIAPKNPEHVRLNLTERDASNIWFLVFGEVLLFVMIGLVVWSRRRR